MGIVEKEMGTAIPIPTVYLGLDVSMMEIGLVWLLCCFVILLTLIPSFCVGRVVPQSTCHVNMDNLDKDTALCNVF